MKIDNTQVFGFESAVRGMRNPKNSWDRSDSMEDYTGCVLDGDDRNWNVENFILGPNDERLSQQLTKAGGEHCKHLRMIQVWFDLDAPRYMWAEFDTYRFVEKVSCSTIHKLFERELTEDNFEINGEVYESINVAIENLKGLRNSYLQAKRNKDSNLMSELLITAKTILPESFLQKRTVNTNYQQLLNIYHQRKNHRLPVWKEFCKWIEQLPYFKELTGIDIKGECR